MVGVQDLVEPSTLGNNQGEDKSGATSSENQCLNGQKGKRTTTKYFLFFLRKFPSLGHLE